MRNQCAQYAEDNQVNPVDVGYLPCSAEVWGDEEEEGEEVLGKYACVCRDFFAVVFLECAGYGEEEGVE